MTTPPAVTVLVTVYNGALHLSESIQSVLEQTMSDFELLIIDDASTDSSRDIIRTFRDPRIRLIEQSPNRGIHGTLNRGLKEARGPYLAIMDQDDLSLPSRLEEQLNHLRSNPNVAVCGSAIETFGENAKPSWVSYFDPDDIKIALLFGNPICHPSVMMNRADLLSLDLSYPNLPFAEEYALWVRTSRVRSISNLRSELLRYRAHPNQVSRLRSDKQSSSIHKIVLEQFDHLEINASHEEQRLHLVLGGAFIPLPNLKNKLANWINRLSRANQHSSVYSEDAFKTQLTHRQEEATSRTQTMLSQMPWHGRLRWNLRSRIRANAPLDS